MLERISRIHWLVVIAAASLAACGDEQKSAESTPVEATCPTVGQKPEGARLDEEVEATSNACARPELKQPGGNKGSGGKGGTISAIEPKAADATEDAATGAETATETTVETVETTENDTTPTAETQGDTTGTEMGPDATATQVEIVTDTQADSEITTDADTDTDTDTDVNVGNGSDIAIATQTHAGSGTGTAAEVDPLALASDRDACVAVGGFWYDADDVQQTTYAGLLALSPSCHETATDACPAAGNLAWALDENEALMLRDVRSVDLYDWNVALIDTVSTLRCFSAATSLDASYSGPVELDIHLAPHLVELHAWGSALQRIIMSRDNDLEVLDVYSAALTSLDTSMLGKLRELNLGWTLIDSLDVTGMPNLEILDVSSTAVNQLDLSQSHDLRELRMSFSMLDLGALDYEAAPGLEALDIAGVRADDLSFLPRSLVHLDMGWCSVPSIDLSTFHRLESLSISYCNYDTLLLPPADAPLASLYAAGLGLSSLNLTPYELLGNLYAYGNQLTQLDLTENPLLRYLDAGSNQLASIDLSANPLLWYVDLSYNQLTSIDLSNQSSLWLLNLRHNQLSYDGSDGERLDLTASASLYSVDLTGNAGFVLRIIPDETFSSTFLTGPWTSHVLHIEAAKWDACTDAGKPAWIHHNDWGYSYYANY